MEQEKKTEGRLVETYAADMAHVIEDDQGGLVKKIIHEQEMKEKEKVNLSPISQINKIYIFLTVIFLTGAILAFLFILLQKKESSVVVEPQFTPIIFNDKSVFLETSDLPKDKIVESILTEVSSTTVQKGEVESIYITKNKQIVGLRGFMSLLKGNLTFPDAALVSDNFMTGVYNGENKDFFILIRARSFQDFFDDLRKWEGKMFYDLHALFGVPINTDTNYLLTKSFDDGIIENKNARILYDKNGGVVMMYVFADENSIIVANKNEVISELISRLSSSKIRK